MLQDLADKLKTAGQPVTLNTALIQSANLIAPPGFDANLKAAFVLPALAAGLQITFDPHDVGDISGNQFQIKNTAGAVQLGQNFLNAKPSQTECVLTFTQPDDSSPLQIQIEVALNGWQFTDYFTFMNDFPFNLLKFSAQTFVFSTVKSSSYQISGAAQKISLIAGQNYAAGFTVPAALAPLFGLLDGFSAPDSAMISGSIVLNKADNENILYPDMDLRAPLSSRQVSVLGFMKACDPFLGLQIKTVEETEDEDGNPLLLTDGDDPQYSQTPFLYLGVYLEVTDANGNKLMLDFAAGKDISDTGFNFSLNVDPDSQIQLTPAAVIGLMVNQSYFALIPSPLQQFLTKIGLRGISVNGFITPFAVSSLAVSLGSAPILPNQSPINFVDPSNSQAFTIKDFTVNWIILNPYPFNAKTSTQLVTISSSFTLFPEVFRKTDGTPGGLFEISLDQDLNVDGKFNGTASFNDLLHAVTNGYIGLPNGVEVSFSDIYLQLNPKVKAYSFGFTLDAEFPLIGTLIQFQNFQLKLSATTPTASGGNGQAKTVYDASINGFINIGEVTDSKGNISPAISLNTHVEFDGTKTPSVWTLKTSLAQPLSITQLLNQFFSTFNINEFPSFLPGDLTVQTFSIEATIPSKSTKARNLLTDGKNPLLLGTGENAVILLDDADNTQAVYQIAGKFEWVLKGLLFGSGGDLTITADIGLKYDGNQPDGQKFSGTVIGEVNIEAINADVLVGYSFGPQQASSNPALLTDGETFLVADLAPVASANSSTLWVQWNGIRAEYKTDKTLTFRLTDWTVGKIIQELVRMIGDPYFTLPSPWDLLNKISLDGLSVTFDFEAKSKGTSWIYANYSLPSPIDLGFMKINGLVFQRTSDGKVTLAIDGSTYIPGMNCQPLFDPQGKGQDVQKMPDVPGRGNKYFDLRLLALGQRVGISGFQNFNSVDDVFKALEKVPSTQNADSNPVNPSNQTPGQPYYNPDNNWLIALDLGLIQVPGTKIYTFECKIVFNDPNLYGLRLSFNGEKAKVLAGLVIDILYKKITDDVGMYQINFSFPGIIRNLNFGAFNIILPDIGIKIYTNGDFLFDFGFPYNLDFSRSFTVQAVIMGIPVTGSAGFYFGKLSSATSTQVPQTTKGTFNPVIVFGLGIQVGVGYDFNKGPLKAGFSITVFFIIEGVIAPYHPYLTDGSGSDVQHDYYFWLQGTVGIIAKLYGKVDFVIISADVELLLQVYVQATYESYHAIPLTIAAHVSIKVSLKINLGLFSVSISFSFATTVSANVTIGHDELQNAPWYDGSNAIMENRRPQKFTRERMRMLQSPPIPLVFKTFARQNDVVPTLNITVAPQFTVHQPDVTDNNQAHQKGAFVLLLAMDAPTADGTGNQNGSSFESLCENLLPWVIDALKNQTGEMTNLTAFTDEQVSKDELDRIMKSLANTASPPISADDIITKFLQPNFTINIAPASNDNQAGLQNGATIFPPLGGLSVTFPDPNGDGGNSTIAFDNYVTITDTYRKNMAAELNRLAAQVNAENGGQSANKISTSDAPEPLARYIFEDYFLLIARQLVQSSLDALDDFAYTLTAKPANPVPGVTIDSLHLILDWLVGRGNTNIQLNDIAAPNLTHPLTGGNVLVLSGIGYTVQQSDTLQTIADRYTDSNSTKRWQTSPADLIINNQTLNTLIIPAVEITFSSGAKYTTQTGDSFASIAQTVRMQVSQLAAEQVLYGMKNLLASSIQITIPDISYTTGGSDTLQGIMTSFAIGLAAILANQTNVNCPYLFDASSGTINIANLESLNLSDLWAYIKQKNQVGQTAGMLARYQLHGMRLPNLDGLGLPTNFAYPTSNQPDYGLFQLTGQQFPTPAFPAPPFPDGFVYSISLGKDSTLSWIEFDGSTGNNSLEITLSGSSSGGNASPVEELYYLLQYVQNNVFDPNPTVSVQPDAIVSPKRQSARSATNWSTSDQQMLISITAPPKLLNSNYLTATAQQPQTQPILWELPDGVLSDAETRASKLSANSAFSFKDINQYLPVYQPQVGTTDPATRQTTFAPVQNYAFSTRVDFQIKKLAQQDDLAPQTPLANDVVPPGSGINSSPAKNLAPFSYELIGPNPSDALLLERLLTAMDSLGEDMISKIFILYPDNAVATTGLVSRADTEFLGFITQTNLSTETNPPPMLFRNFAATQDKTLGGIINSHGDFVKMMWELSTVRSGGYYLYYEIIGQGIGLPDALFDDSGVATLTLVIAYDRNDEPANGGRITNFVNSFVTTDSIDFQRSVMTLESQSEQAQTAALAGTESLQIVSDSYGVEVGLLAQLNPQKQLTDKIQLPISGISRQVTPADLASQNVLENFASYYSQGAVQPISAADIANYNPGVQPVLYSVFRIPPITCTVSSANLPGNNFAALQAYYDLSADALADSVRRAPGIFVPNITLTVDSISHDVQPALGTGNVGVALTRANLGEPPDLPAAPDQNQIQTFVNAYLSSLYTLLTAGLYGNAFFNSSQPGIPFGPRKPLSSEEGEMLRHPESRQTLLTAQTDEDFQYSQTIGFIAGNFSKVNPAPQSPQSPLPPQSANPYTGIGTAAQFNLQWADIFGNRLVTPFTAPPQNYSGALNNIPVEVDYVDRLIGLERWSNVRVYYTYAGTSASPHLVINFDLQICAYQSSTDSQDARNQMSVTDVPVWQQNALNDQKRFTEIYFQLNQNYDGLNIPGLSGQAVSMSLINTLLTNEKTQLSDQNAQSVRDFVSNCLSYVTNRAGGQDGGTQPICQLQIPLDSGQISSDDVIELSLSLALERQSELCDPALRVVTGGTSAVSTIAPLMEVIPTGIDCSAQNPPVPQQNIKVFADAFEGVFYNDDWQMRVGTSAPDPGQPRGKETSAVWAVKMGKKPGNGFYYEIQDHASFYAPKPIAKNLESALVSIAKYSTGNPFPGDATDATQVTFTGVDLNTWANTALSTIDTFLSPGFSNPAYILDSLLYDKPETDGYLAQILKHKQTLADAIGSTVSPILNTSAVDKISLAAAREKLRQALLNRLSNAFITTAVTVFGVSNVSVDPPTSGEFPRSRFYGQLQKNETAITHAANDVSNDDTAEQNYSLTTGKIQYFESADETSGDWRLPFLFSSKNVKEQTYVSLPLSYALTHLECDITNVPGIENYEQSTWIQIVNAPFNTPINGGKNIDFPVVLRALPTPPSMTAQTADSDVASFGANTAGLAPSELAFWNYSLGYRYSNSAQDSVTTSITLNWQNLLNNSADDENPLFAPLAQFISVYNEILTDLETFLRKINASSKLTDTDAVNAKAALDAFEQIVGAVAAAYKKWATPSHTEKFGDGLEQIIYSFDIVLESGEDGNARIDVINAQISGTTGKLPPPIIEIESYNYVDAQVKPPNAIASYNYTLQNSPAFSENVEGTDDPPVYLSYEQALNISDRKISLKGLNVFTLQNALGQIQVIRNEYLISEQTVKTNEEFEFSTPPVKYASSAIPSLVYKDYDLSGLQVDKLTLENYLNVFFASLLQNADGLSIMVKMTAAFSYQVAPLGLSFPRTTLPIALLPPEQITIQNGASLPVVAPFADTINQWRKLSDIKLISSSEYNISLEIFAGESDDSALQMPLLTIRNLFIDANKIQSD